MKPLLRFSVSVPAITIALLLAEPLPAQTRYKDIVFPSATSALNVEYGSNLNVGGTTATLLMDVYQPTGDTVTSRPLVIFLHGGSLVVGEKESMGLFCSDFAKRGFVAATLNYRLGVETPEGTKTILEALLRGVQDTRAAVRFFRSKASEYGIDTSQIYLVGSSAGSMIAVHHAYWGVDEIPNDIDTAKWGSIEGNSGNPGWSSDVTGVVNYCGALIDATWIDAGEAPVANFHGLLDQVVPPDSGISSEFDIELFGGVAISRIATQLGIYNQGAFFPQMGHGGNEDSLRLFSANFIYSMIVLSSAVPQDFTSMELSADSLRVFRYDNKTFTVSALDTGGNRIILPQSMITYSCDAGVGTIAPTGIFTPSAIPDSGYVYATFNGVTDSCSVKTYDFAFFVIRPKHAVTDTLRTITLRIDTYDSDSLKHDLKMSMFTLTSTDPLVGTIDALGTFTGLKSGTTQIIASFNGYSDTSIVSVEGAVGLVSFDSLESLGGWTFEGTNLDSLSVTLTSGQKSSGEVSMRIGYKLTYDASKPTSMVYLNKNLVVYGIPDSIYLDVRSDGRRHRLYYQFEDAEAGIFRGSGLKYLNDSTGFSNVNAAMTGFTALTDIATVSYPLTLKRIEIQLAPVASQGVITSGTIYIDNLRLKYPGIVTGVEGMPVIPAQFVLGQNFPNPFNPTTTIRYDLPTRSRVVLVVYNILGEKVTELVHGEQNAGRHEARFDAGGLATGVYMYRLQAGNFVQTRKLVVMK